MKYTQVRLLIETNYVSLTLKFGMGECLELVM